jgi:glutamate-5-semialdehyde dehydrogenase
MMVEEIGKRAKAAALLLSGCTDEQRSGALKKMTDALVRNSDRLMVQNLLDMENGKQAGLSEAMLDRLKLTQARIAAMAEGLRSVAALPNPLGRTLWESKRPNGLFISKVSVPLGVIAVIYESRPNVTADSAGLCLKSGNACILRGGRESMQSNLCIAQILHEALAESGIPEDSMQLITDPSRKSAEALMRLTGYVDLLIPRGGKGLIDSVVENARVPVLRTGDGVCHIYVDKEADIDMAASIIHNAKTSRPSVCNACECMLIHQGTAERALPEIAKRLASHAVTIYGDEGTRRILPEALPAQESDWGREFLDLSIACKVVCDMDEAMEHIRRFSTGHSEAIVTGDEEAANRFLTSVDSAAVYHNASTRFTDGGEFGFGAEIGISTQKLHARGPTGLNELTSYKYIIRGKGQIR